MGKRRLWLLLFAATLVSIFLTGVSKVTAVYAQDTTPPAPQDTKRKTVISVDYTLYTWWMINWSNNQAKCSVLVEHEGQPVGSEILFHCGTDLYTRWVNTKPCEVSNQDNHNQCNGVYLFLAKITPSERQVEIEIPPPVVTVSLIGCQPVQPQNRCTRLPSLLLTGEESLPNETVIRIQGLIGGRVFSCAGNRCAIPLHPSGIQGQNIEFWADSSFGDSSEHFTAMVRVQPWGDFMAPEGGTQDPTLWYVDVLSSQWRGTRPASCSDTWQVFPDVGGPPSWLITPSDPQELASADDYYYLAGMLIRNGAVDVSMCADGGMDGTNIASECGLNAAAPKALEWQNRFDNEIVQVSQESGVPAQLLKNIFSRESQFWPGIYKNLLETGLGQMTEKGADTVLLWNSNFYDQFCPLVLHKEICQNGFGNLTTENQDMLRGALVSDLNATCVDCPVGINLENAHFSIKVFAQTLLANCEQVERIVRSTTQQVPGQMSSYTDLWRFTLVNYNAGPGCLLDAAGQTRNANEPLDWDHLQNHLAPACVEAVGYVNDISQVPETLPAPIVEEQSAIQTDLPELGNPDQPEQAAPQSTETPAPEEETPAEPTEEPPVD